eukprot:5857131-Amphidinium_carterae.1
MQPSLDKVHKNRCFCPGTMALYACAQYSSAPLSPLKMWNASVPLEHPYPTAPPPNTKRIPSKDT